MNKNIVGSANYIVQGDSIVSYATARGTSAAYSASLDVGQYKPNTTRFLVYRGFLKFDTSSIPDAATITKVNLRMVCIGDSSTNNFDVQIVEQDWSAQDPISSGTRQAAYVACLAAASSFLWRNTSGIATNTQYISDDLTNAYVNKSGSTYYSLRSSRDYAGSAPANSTTEFINLALVNNAEEGYRPTLIVEYTLPGGKPQVAMISEFGMI